MIAALAAAGPAVAGRAASAQMASASSSPAQVTVIPADPYPGTTRPTDDLLFAGATGFLHRFSRANVPFSASGYLWTNYASGSTSVVAAMAKTLQGSFSPAGNDSIAIYPTTVSTPLTELDLATGASSTYPVPAGDQIFGLFGNAMVVGVASGTTATYSVLTFASDGSYATKAVTGLPAGAGIWPIRAGDATDALVKYASAGSVAWGLIDLSSGTFTAIPNSTLGQPLLSASSVAVQTSGTSVDVFSRSGLTSGTNTTPQTVALPAGNTYRIALAGEDVVAVPANSGSPAVAVPVSGGNPVIVAAETQNGPLGLATTPNSALLVGGSGVADWSVRQIGTDAGGNLVNTALLPLTKIVNAGLTISQGDVWHAEATPDFGKPDYLLFGHPLLSDNNWDAAYQTSLYDLLLNDPVSCVTGSACVRVADGNSYGPVYLGAVGNQVRLYEGNGYAGDVLFPPSTVVDASSDYVIMDEAATTTSPARQVVIDVGYARVVSTEPVAGADLWFDTLWRASAPGELQATNLTTMGAAKPISTGSDCTATDVQATARWIYWSCGTSGPAGVYDLQAKVDIPVPGRPALLGDGYLVQQDPSTGDLVMYDVHTDSVTGPVTLATDVASSPTADGRDITWAVDKYSGDVAYVDASNAVHVIDTGVPAVPVAIGEPSAAQLRNPGSFSPTGWSQPVFITRPISGWTLTIRRSGSGQVVNTASGGPARYGLTPTWNFRLPDGAKAYSGQYTWTLTATAVGDSGPTTLGNYRFTLECGQVPFHSIDCDGASALLAVDPLGNRYWYEGTSKGRLSDQGFAARRPLCSAHRASCVTALALFGDFGSTGYADLLVRTGNGVLRAYLGAGQPYFTSSPAKPIRIAGNWDRYNALVAPGAMTPSGVLELLARDRSGRLWRYAATGHGKFRGRKLISGGWQQYTRLIGAGDLTGDGIGDMLAVDSRGTMWAYYGDGRGGFGPRHRVSSGWNQYTAIIGIGDLTNDGNNDLIVRSKNGQLWLLPGTGHDQFGKPVNLHLNLRRFSLF
jgi:hypothetical protein